QLGVDTAYLLIGFPIAVVAYTVVLIWAADPLALAPLARARGSSGDVFPPRCARQSRRRPPRASSPAPARRTASVSVCATGRSVARSRSTSVNPPEYSTQAAPTASAASAS